MKKVLILFMILTFSFFGIKDLKAESNPFTQDGKYEVKINLDMTMGASNFFDYVYVEKYLGNYYLTFMVKDKNSIIDIKLHYGLDEVGLMYKEEGVKAFYTYTLEKEALSKSLSFTGFVPAMKMDVNWKISLKLNSAKYLGYEIDDRGERPACYLPTIEASNGELNLERGSYYQVVVPKAYLKDEELEVKTEVYYVKENINVPVSVIEDRFMLEEIGEYHVIFTASSKAYKTSLGNETKKMVDIKINSKANVTHLAKAQNINESTILPLNTNVQAVMVSSDSKLYQDLKEVLKKKSNNFEIINVSLFDIKGKEIIPTEDIYLYLLANPSYDRNKIEVYHLNQDNELELMESEGYGRYVRVKTKDLDNFVIVLPGVPFVMPMWGYALITVGVVLVLATLITVPIFVIKKKRKKEKQMLDE